MYLEKPKLNGGSIKNGNIPNDRHGKKDYRKEN